jgi:tRNA (guanine-N7-)-methyltransferase
VDDQSGGDPGELRGIWGRRQGRPLRAHQQALIDDLLPRVAIPKLTGDPPVVLDPATLFDPPVKRVWLEIGFGGGEHLAAQAAAHPDVGLIGVEPFLNGVASALSHIERASLANVRLLMGDARELLAALPDRSLDRAFILFPDPWPKTRHHKRRIVSTAVLDRLARLLRPGAELRLASDDQPYVAWMLEHVLRHDAFAWTARCPDDWRQRPATPPGDWPATRYEAKALARGAAPTFLRFVRKSD